MVDLTTRGFAVVYRLHGQGSEVEIVDIYSLMIG
jgi:hypothetical protein